jgi:iron-sulfur cluster repair protein YtfE (RIC family)
MTAPTSTPEATGAAPSVRQRMIAEHVHLAELCNRVISTFAEGDREACDASFRQLETELETHLSFEDRELLPRLAEEQPAQAAALADAHKAIRARLTELGIGVDLHATRCSAVRALVGDLGEHAHREGELLYDWADRNVDEPTRRGWLDRLRH